MSDQRSAVSPLNEKKKDGKTEEKNAFFDPLLRPPPKVQQPWSAALLVLVPLMLGIHSVNKEYVEEVKEVLRHKRCVGIIGGSPNHAIYFVGYRGDLLLGLDPHTVFANPPVPPSRSESAAPLVPAVPLDPAGSKSACDGARVGVGRGVKREPTTRLSESSDCGRAPSSSHTHPTAARSASAEGSSKAGLGLNSSYSAAATNDTFFTMFGAAAFSSSTGSDCGEAAFPSAEYLHQVHVSEFVTLDIARLDPSLAIGFYFANRGEFDAFCEETRVSVARKLREGRNPLYNVQDLAPSFMYAGEGDGEGSGDGDDEDEEEEETSFETNALRCETSDAVQDSSGAEEDGDGEGRGRREVEAWGDGMDEGAAHQAQQAQQARADKIAAKAAKAAKVAEAARKRAAASRRRSSRGRNVSDAVASDPDDEEYVLV